MKRYWLTFIFCGFAAQIVAQKSNSFHLNSPDSKINVEVKTGENISWEVNIGSQKIILPSEISMTLRNEVLGKNAILNKKTAKKVNQNITPYLYKKDKIVDQYNELKLDFIGNYSLEFRAYNDGVAYRFVTNKSASEEILTENVEFNFAQDHSMLIPYANDPRYKGDFLQTSFEALYTPHKISEMKPDAYSLLPLMVEMDNNVKVLVTEANTNGYSGMHLQHSEANQLKGVFAQYPKTQIPGGHNKFNSVVTERFDYVAKVQGKFHFPWRTMIISTQDKDLLSNDMVYKLAEPTKIKDLSWIKPGKVSWEWWNDWGLTNVDFKAGINNKTYQYYIDFAAKKGLEYVIVDDGWSNVEITDFNPNLDISEVINYGKQKNVGIILWATWRAIWENPDAVFEKYSKLGAKGFKIDFLDRDDAEMTASTYIIAEKAAQYQLILDLHGMYKPDGIQRTYPNVVNFEGVKGLENAKWAVSDDFPKYAVTAPFIRMVNGPIDYTPGAMKNASKMDYRPSNANPESQGTRAHQVAMYVAFDAPLQMLADSPTQYEKEQETTDFISKIPTTFDETLPLDGKVGEYLAVAKRKGTTWYVGALTNWNEKKMTIDLSFLSDGYYEICIFMDGYNVDKNPQDYTILRKSVKAGDQLPIFMGKGGGWTAQITKK